MALATATVTMDLSDLLGVDFDARRTKVWISTNVPNDTVIDTADNKIRLGSGNVTVATDGTASLDVWVPGSGSNPASWQTYVHVDYPDRQAHGGRGKRTFGPFTITASADLADLVDEQEVPPEYVTTLTAALDGYVTEAEAAAAIAQSAADLATAITGIDTTDEAVAAGFQITDSESGAYVSAMIGAEVTPVKQGLLPPILTRTSTTAAGSGPRFIDYWGGYMWGADPSGDIFRSSNEGVTWSAYCNSYPGPDLGSILRITPTDDGEVLVLVPSGLFKSSGWANGNAATWSANKVTLTGTGSVLVAFGLDGDGTKFILGEYATPEINWANSRKGWISTNAGTTWTQMWDSDTDAVSGAPGDSHVHGVCYDPFRDRFYLAEGHGTGGGVYCSTDDGATWSRAPGMVPDPNDLPGPVLNNGPTVIVATDDGLVMGSDNSPQNGLFGVATEADPAKEVMIQTWAMKTGQAGLIMFAQRGWRDPRTGQVFVTFRAEASTTPISIAAGTAHTGGEVFRHTLPSVGGVDRFGAIASPSPNRLVAFMSTGTGPEVPAVIRGTLTRPGGRSRAMVDKGAMEGGVAADPTAVSVGTASEAPSLRSTSVGAFTRSTQDGTGLGYNADVTGAGGTAVGSNASCAGPSSVALGVNTASSKSFEVQMGPRHIALGVKAMPSLPVDEELQLVAIDDGFDKEQLVVQFKSGARRILATEQGLRSISAANHTHVIGDDVIVMVPGGTPRTATLRAAAGRNGERLTLKNMGPSDVTVGTSGGLIDGAATKTLTTNQFATFISNGTDWLVIG